jgi:predicted nucleic acid-binding protein
VIVYVDASALVKRYVSEAGSADVNALTAGAAALATALVTRVEVAAAFARAVRGGVLDDVAGRKAQRRFSREWPDFMRVPVTEALVARAEALAWAHGLRGYDAVQLASALTWQDALGQEIVLATFDRQLWEAGPEVGLRAWPTKLPN